MKRDWNLIRSVLVAATLIFALTICFAVICRTPSYQQCYSNYNKDHESQASAKELTSVGVVLENVTCTARFIDRHNGFVGAIATVWIAWFTATLWVTSREQYRQLKRSVDVLAQSERPHLLIEDIKVNGLDVQGGLAVVNYKIVNRGKSPAWIAEAVICFKKLKELPLSPEYGQPEKMFGTTVSPDKSLAPLRVSAVQLSSEDATKIFSGNLNLFLYGFVKYKDPFEQIHTNRFAYRWDASPGIYEPHIETFDAANYWEYT